MTITEKNRTTELRTFGLTIEDLRAIFNLDPDFNFVSFNQGENPDTIIELNFKRCIDKTLVDGEEKSRMAYE